MDPSTPTTTRAATPAVARSDRLRTDLSSALKAHDSRRVSVLRTALAAIANAETPDTAPSAAPVAPPVAGRLIDHPRRLLSEAEVDAVLQAEIDDRFDTIGLYTRAGRHDDAEVLQDEIAILAGYLD